MGESCTALADILTLRDAPATTLDKPITESVSAGKNTYTYDAHTYHTKVPPQGIANIIGKYLPEGGVVLDPFAGSGMTGVAARYLGCDVILNELSPAASFISHNFLRTVDASLFTKTVHDLVNNLSDLRQHLYTTKCRECDAPTEILFTVWSYDLECNHCSTPFTLWDHCRKYGNNVKEHKLLKKFPCPHCGEEVNKSYLKRHASKPVFVGYRCCSRKIVERALNDEDHHRLASFQQLLAEYANDIPTIDLPDGVNLNQPKRHGLKTIRSFYTDRNLISCAAIWREIKRISDPELSAALAFVFTSLYQRVTKLSEYRFWGGSGNTANFNVPHISNESNVFVTFLRKSKSISDHYMTTATNYSGRHVVRTGSATELGFLPDNSIDLIFTDPPFGGNINYSEMNILWEAWLDTFTNNVPEAIINKSRRKTLTEYQSLMTRSLQEAYRVLRPGHWMVLVFMNSSENVWSALQSAIKEAGFRIEQINIFDKQHSTFKQYVSDNTAGSDLMLHCRKPEEGDNHIAEHMPMESVRSFLERASGNVPVLPFLHVSRASEVDYRTLYARYISTALSNGVATIGFAQFRSEAKLVLEGELNG